MKRYLSQVADIMSSPPIVITPSASIASAYALMRENEIRRLLVVSERGNDPELIGIVTESDILRALPLLVDEGDSESRLLRSRLTVADVMTYDPVTVDPEDSIQEAAERMLEFQISGLPVISGGRPVGIVTESDIFRLVVEELSQERQRA